MRPSRVGLLLIAVVLLAGVTLLIVRSDHHKLSTPKKLSSAEYLDLLQGDRQVAQVGSVILTSAELRDTMQSQFSSIGSHASMSAENLSSKTAEALEKLIENEVLAQEARQRGLTTSLSGNQARQELADQLIKVEATSLPPVTDQELREFYKDHGEKFTLPPSIEVKELFLRTKPGGSKEQRKSVNELAKILAARITQGEPIENIAGKYASAEDRDLANAYLFTGKTMEVSDEQKVLNLSPGQVAGPFRVEGGYSVFQGISRPRSRSIPFFQAQEKIRVYLETQRMIDVRKQLLDKLLVSTDIQRYNPEGVDTGKS